MVQLSFLFMSSKGIDMSIFDKIEQISYSIAHKIGKNDSEDDIELYEYSVFMIFSNLFTVLCGFIISLIFGYPLIYLLCLFSYSFLHMVAGGQHCETFKKCFIVSNLVIILCCLLTIFTKNIYEIMFVVSIIFFINTIPTCPKPSENSPSRGETGNTIFRKKLSFRFTILLILNLFFICFNMNVFSTCVSSSIVVLCVVLTRFGEKIILKI